MSIPLPSGPNRDAFPSSSTSSDDFRDPAVYALKSWGIAERLKLQRTIRRLSIRDVADRVPIDASLLSKIEEGRRGANPSLKTLERIADVLGLNLAGLLAAPSEMARLSEPLGFEHGESTSSRTLFELGRHRLSVLDRGVSLPSSNSVQIRRWSLPKGSSARVNNHYQQGQGTGRSIWMVYQGSARLQLKCGSIRVDEAVLPESVLHIQSSQANINRIEALDDVVVLQVNY
jgi:transcriptional regulator with XRE-family HTH domain